MSKLSNKQYIKINDEFGNSRDVVAKTWSDMTADSVIDRKHYMFLTVFKDTTTGKRYATFTCAEDRTAEVYAIDISKEFKEDGYEDDIK